MQAAKMMKLIVLVVKVEGKNYEINCFTGQI